MNHIFQASLYIYSFCTVCLLRMSGWCSRERAKEERVWSDHTCILLASLLCSAIILTLMDFITISKICAVHVYKFILQKGLGQCHCHAVFGKKIAGKFELIIRFRRNQLLFCYPIVFVRGEHNWLSPMHLEVINLKVMKHGLSLVTSNPV